MCLKLLLLQLSVVALTLMMPMAGVSSYKRNYEAKDTKANIPLWKQRACEKAQKYKANSHYICDDKGDVKCLPGWQGDLCQVPMCRKGCDPMNGYCQRPGECRCRIGYTGELCDKCIPLPGCQHGDCTKPFECICRPGWDGLFCTEPTCRQGCHNTRGYCESPGECRCRIGWAGRNCSDCSVLPGCQHGTCSKPLECNCLPGYTGLLCQTPICNADCHKQHGYCKRPGECRCKVGWTGSNCDKCFPYPGCVNGDCEKPWECNCKPGWGGILCDEELTYCKNNPYICENKGKCISLTKEDGSYRCHCRQGYLGKNCEIIDEFLLTSTAAPRITPPPLLGWDEDDDEDQILNSDNEIQASNKKEVVTQLSKNDTIKESKGNQTELLIKLKTEEVDNKINNNTMANTTTIIKENVTETTEKPVTSSSIKTNDNSTVELVTLPTLNDIIGTATMQMNTTKIPSVKKSPKNPSKINKVKTSTTPTTPTGTTNPSLTSSSSNNASTTTMSPLNKLDEDKNLHDMPLKSPSDSKKPATESGDDDDDDDDEECTEDDNDDECEYVDDDE